MPTTGQTVQFGEPTYTYNETVGSATLDVTLSAMPLANVSVMVDYATSDGTAKTGTDILISTGNTASEVVQGTGDSTTAGGLGTYTFNYTASGNTAGYNSWATKTVVSNPDGSSDTVYTNAYAQVMLDDHYDPSSGQDTDEFYAYNSQGQMTLDAAPSAVMGYYDGYADFQSR